MFARLRATILCHLLGIGLGLGLGLGLGAASLPNSAEGQERLVRVEEYLSLTCPHCAAFHRDIFPLIERDYIATRKIQFHYRDFPLDRLALRAAVLARCGGARLRPKLIAAMLEKQDFWLRAQNPEQKLLDILGLLGIGAARAQQCLEDKSLQHAVLAEQIRGRKTYDISSTPSLIVAGRKLDRLASKRVRAAIEKALQATAQR